jgi:hypothetical protein
MELQWSFYEKILQFDRGFEARVHDGIVIAALYQERFRPSLRARDEIMGLAQQSDLGFGGHDVTLVPIDVTSLEEVERQLIEHGADILYFPPLRAAPLRELARLAVEHRLVTITGVADYLDSGIGIGLTLRVGRPVILVNLESCRAQGVQLSAELLQIAAVQ